MLSVAWMARELDFDKYQKNDLIPIRILIDSKIYDLYIRYLGVVKSKIAGRKQECYVFSPLLVEGEVEAKILVGSVKAILDRSASKYGDFTE